MRDRSRITHSLRLPAHVDASRLPAGASFSLEMRRAGPEANKGAEVVAAPFQAERAVDEWTRETVGFVRLLSQSRALSSNTPLDRQAGEVRREATPCVRDSHGFDRLIAIMHELIPVHPHGLGALDHVERDPTPVAYAS